MLGITDIRTPYYKLYDKDLPEELQGLGIEYIKLVHELKAEDLDIEEIKRAVEVAKLYAKDKRRTP